MQDGPGRPRVGPIAGRVLAALGPLPLAAMRGGSTDHGKGACQTEGVAHGMRSCGLGASWNPMTGCDNCYATDRRGH